MGFYIYFMLVYKNIIFFVGLSNYCFLILDGLFVKYENVINLVMVK